MFKCDLPSGKSVVVNPPNFMDRVQAVKDIRSMKDEPGYTVEELIAAKSVKSVDDVEVRQGFAMDPIYVLSDWHNGDVQYFLEWFMTLFFLEDKVRDRAQEAAKKIKFGQPDTSSKK